MDQRLSAGEREVIPEYGTPTEYPVAYPGSGNPAQYSDMPGFSTGQIPVHYRVQPSVDVPVTRPLGYVPSGSVSS
jgi:hypothetical protein